MAAPTIDELSAALAQQTKLLESDPSDRRRSLISDLEEEINRRKTQASIDAAAGEERAAEGVPTLEAAARLIPEALVAPGMSNMAGRQQEITRQTGFIPPAGPGGMPYIPPEGVKPISDPAAVDAAGEAEQARTAQAAADNPWLNIGANVLGALTLGKMIGPATTVPGRLAQGAVIATGQGARARGTAGADLDQIATGMLIDAPLGMAGAALPLAFMRPAMPAVNAARAPTIAPAAAGAAGGYGLAGVGNAAEKGLVHGQDVTAGDFFPTDPLALIAGGIGAAQGAAPGFRQNLRNPASGQSSIDVRNVEAAGGSIGLRGADVPSLKGTSATGAQLGLLDDPQGTYKLPQGHNAQRTVLADQLGRTLIQEGERMNAALKKRFQAIEDAVVSRPGGADRFKDIGPVVDEIDGMIQGRSFDDGVPISPGVVAQLQDLRARLVPDLPASSVLGPDGRPAVAARAAMRALTQREIVALRRELAELGNEGKMAGRDDVPFRRISEKVRELFVSDLDEAAKARHEEMTMQERFWDSMLGLQGAEINERANQPRRIASAAEKLGSNKRAAAASNNQTFQEAVSLLEQLGQRAGVATESPKLFQQAVAANSAERLRFPGFRTTTDPKGHVRFGISPDLSMWETAKVRLDPAALMSINPTLLPIILGTQPADITIDTREQK